MEDLDNLDASQDVNAKTRELINELKESINYDIAKTKDKISKLKKTKRKLEELASDDQSINERVNATSEEIYKAEAELRAYKAQLKDIDDNTVSEASEEKDANVRNAIALLNNLLINDESLGYSIDDSKYVFVNNYHTQDNSINVAINQLDSQQFITWLAREIDVCQWHLPPALVSNTFKTAGKIYDKIRYTVNPVSWNNKVYQPIHHLKKYFIDKVDVSTLNYNDDERRDIIKHFNWLMHSLSGGKQENQDHIEKFILHKVINYDKPTTTPDLVIVGHVGGNGKGVLQGIIRQMFPSSLSGKANSKTLSGNFNAIMLGKLLVFFDDQDSKEIQLEKVKELAGADTMVYEPKGKDQYEGEKTHSSAWFANKLPFKLTPGGKEGGVDRRFSIMRTSITFLDSIKHHLKSEGIDNVGIEVCKTLAETIVTDTFQDREKIAIWFDFLRKKHPEVVPGYTLQVLHGEDYKYFLNEQRSTLSDIFDELILPILNNNGCIPMEVIKDLVRIYDGDNKGKTHKKLFDEIQEISHLYNIELEMGQSKITILSNGGREKWRTITLHKTGNTFTKEFDWSLVSTSPFRRSSSKDEFLLASDTLSLSIDPNIEIDDDEDEISIINNDLLNFAKRRK